MGGNKPKGEGREGGRGKGDRGRERGERVIEGGRGRKILKGRSKGR